MLFVRAFVGAHPFSTQSSKVASNDSSCCSWPSNAPISPAFAPNPSLIHSVSSAGDLAAASFLFALRASLHPVSYSSDSHLEAPQSFLIQRDPSDTLSLHQAYTFLKRTLFSLPAVIIHSSSRAFEAMPNRQVKPFRLDGFSLGKDKLFGDTNTLARVNFCILGPSNAQASPEKKIATVEDALAKLFDILADSRTLFTTLRDNEIFWTAIGAQWANFRPLPSQDIKNIVDVYVAARQDFLADPRNLYSLFNRTTPLKEAVDRWIDLYDEVMALPPTARVAKLTLNPNRSEVDRLADTLDNFSIDRDSTWLPAHITVQEYLWICEGHVEDQLRTNLTINGRLKLPFRPRTSEDIPTLPNNLSHPTDTRMFLCFTGLTRFNPANSKFAVFMKPIGFFHGSDRKDWYLATGTLSTKHAIFTEYYQHAVRMITKHGRDRVYGIVTYWMDRPEQFVDHYEKDKTERQTRSTYWNDNCMRYGLGLCVAKMPRGSHGYRIIMYDMDYPNLMKHPEVPNTGDKKVDETIVCLREWRDVASTAADVVFKDTLQEWWQGGNRPQRLTRDYQITYPRHDPVSHSCAWLWDMVNGFGPGVDALDREMAQ